jgi:phospholipid transport system substrate-binding protein
MSMPNVLKSPRCHAMCFAALLTLGIPAGLAGAAPVNGVSVVQRLYDAFLSTMKNGHSLAISGRFAELEPVIRRSFDLPAMARLAVGPSWGGLSKAQRQGMTESFGRYISAIYADRFESYAGQRLQVTGEQPAAAGLIVRSQIIKANGEPVNIDYMMRRNGETWLITDIYLDGAISEVATRRSEFAAVLESDGIDGLIASLNRKKEELVRTSISERPDRAR